MQSLNLSRDQYLELEKIGLDAFAPLKGFMDSSQFNSVIECMRLPGGEIFPLPILLDIDSSEATAIKIGSRLFLKYQGEIVGSMTPSDIFQCNRSYAARKIFGTDNITHPGVNYFFRLKDTFIGGGVELIKRSKMDISSFEVTPKEAKAKFRENGWKKVAGFQTRNVPHRAHEYLIRLALEVSDGVFVQPLVGKKRKGDYTPEAIFKGYDAIIENYLPKNRIVLGSLSTLMRYAGPREAIFHALIRRNYGCTHFIVGRDHAGVSDWYGLYEAQSLALEYEDELGIKILDFKGPYYCQKCDGIATVNSCAHYQESFIEHISGTYMRSILKDGLAPDSHLMRKEVVEAIKNIQCFIDEE